MNDNSSRFSPALYHALSLVERMTGGNTVIVPAEPTLPMTTAGARSGHVTQAAAANIYRAMVRAAGQG
ncbi:MAG TPA: hypothetical protein VM661_08030 [Candidatus Sulfotelmatobacter sp.]|jgi:hypothetical protein|nr:hypothetical protein [Candidatus Sulfotelmatobacter sp.]